MSDHFNTAPGWPQTREEVQALDNPKLEEFMGLCDVEPADFDNCLACYAYGVVLERADPRVLFTRRQLPLHDDPERCQWFLLCENSAVGASYHPVLGLVPICQRCADKFELEVQR